MSGTNGKGLAGIVDPRAARQALAGASGRSKLDLFLSAPDPRALVQSLPAQELYFAILDIGKDDAAEIVALASPEQFQHFVDLAGWPRRDAGADTKTVLGWLTLAREGGGHSTAALQRYLEKLAHLDVELFSLLLRRSLKVFDLEEEPEPKIENPGQTFHTPEGRYLVEFTEGGPEYAVLKQLLDDFYAQDVLGTTRMLEALRWEVPTELEETARRWRDGRLRDLGFPDLDEALAFYARPARAPSPTADSTPIPTSTSTPTATSIPTATPTATPTPTPAALILREPTETLLESAVAQLEGAERERAEEAILYAMNAALVANGVSLDDPDEVRTTLRDARATLALGLDLLSGGDSARASRALAERSAREIFQTGIGDGYRLQGRARRIAASARLPQAQTVTLLDPPLSDAVDALARQRPALHDPEARDRRRALGSRSDVARAEELLDEAEATVRLLEALGASAASLGPLAEAAGIAPTALRASHVLRALALTSVRGKNGLSLEGAHAEEQPPGFAAKLDELLQEAAHKIDHRAAARAAARLRRAVLG